MQLVWQPRGRPDVDTVTGSQRWDHAVAAVEGGSTQKAAKPVGQHAALKRELDALIEEATAGERGSKADARSHSPVLLSLLTHLSVYGPLRFCSGEGARDRDGDGRS